MNIISLKEKKRCAALRLTMSDRVGKHTNKNNSHQGGSPVAQILPVSEILVSVLDYPRTGGVLQFRGGTLVPTRNPPRCCRILRGLHQPRPRLSSSSGRGRSAGPTLPTFGQPVWWAVEKRVPPSGRRRSAARAAATAPPAVLVALEGFAAGGAEVQDFGNRLVYFGRVQGEGEGDRVGSGTAAGVT